MADSVILSITAIARPSEHADKTGMSDEQLQEGNSPVLAYMGPNTHRYRGNQQQREASRRRGRICGHKQRTDNGRDHSEPFGIFCVNRHDATFSGPLDLPATPTLASFSRLS